jgi:hypothetical protein
MSDPKRPRYVEDPSGADPPKQPTKKVVVKKKPIESLAPRNILIYDRDPSLADSREVLAGFLQLGATTYEEIFRYLAYVFDANLNMKDIVLVEDEPLYQGATPRRYTLASVLGNDIGVVRICNYTAKFLFRHYPFPGFPVDWSSEQNDSVDQRQSPSSEREV